MARTAVLSPCGAHAMPAIGHTCYATHRRATSHRRFVSKRRPNLRLAAQFKRARVEQSGACTGAEVEAASSAGQLLEGQARPTSRAMRRRPAALHARAAAGAAPVLQLPGAESAGRGLNALREEEDEEMEEAETNKGLTASAAQPAAAAVTPRGAAAAAASASPAWRLETHAWHARRMCMHPSMWGHALPWQAPGKGKGSRSLLHQARSHAVLHDASYWGCLQLSGHQQEIVRVLELVR